MGPHHPAGVIRGHPRATQNRSQLRKGAWMEAARPARQQRRGAGWAGFAAVMVFMAGVFNVMDGVAALANDDHFAVSQLLFGDLTLWGVIWLVTGSLQVIAALLIFNGSNVGAVMGI